MKYICLGYIEPNKFESMSESERNAMVDECWAYDDELRAKGHFAGGEGLQPPQTATTLRWKNGKVTITDGPYAETKEQLGGILIGQFGEVGRVMDLHDELRFFPGIHRARQAPPRAHVARDPLDLGKGDPHFLLGG